ncbi:MAG: PD40 domain-containing protein, partial [Myxococcales bacterium]|nr:PD40 domain-containing protein [Myxococcales bacterium]
MPAGPPACGRVAFVAGEGHHDEAIHRVFVVAADGSGAKSDGAAPQKIAEVLASEPSMFPAAVAPDGSKLLLLSSQPLPEAKSFDRLFLLPLDQPLPGTLTPLGPQGELLRNPAWAPDASFIVFESDADSFRDLYRVQIGSDTPLRLTNDPQGNFEPEVSPDGQSIVFVSSRDGNAEVYVMAADGGDPRRLTNSPGDDSAPQWSPDGKTLAFSSSRASERGIDVYLMAADGSEQRPAVEASRGQVMARDLAWSPDGKQLAFTQLIPERGAGVVIVDVAAGEIVARSSESDHDEQPSWSGDGRFLAFTRTRAKGGADESARIMRMDPGGGAAIALTPEGGE